MTFSDFWTNDNNPKLPESEYLYNARHLSVLVLVVIIPIILTLIFYKKSQRAKQILFYVFGGLFLFFEILSRIVNLIITDLNFKMVMEILLPQFICSVMVWVFIVALFSKNQLLLNFSVIGGLLATSAFLLFPAVGLNRKYMTFTCLYSTISHSLGFICAILLMTLKQVKFPLKQIWQPYLCFAVMFSWGALLTYSIFPGSDPMFLVNDPLELNLKFSHLILYGILLVVYVFIYYGAYSLIKFINEKNFGGD